MLLLSANKWTAINGDRGLMRAGYMFPYAWFKCFSSWQNKKKTSSDCVHVKMRTLTTAAQTTTRAKSLVRSVFSFSVAQPLNYLRGAISCPLPSIAGSSSKEFFPAEAVLDDDACTEMLEMWLFTPSTLSYCIYGNTVIHTQHKPQ